ncbi:probable linoleate 9S-lipoxygenase 5, partial [Tanacetum coccineum]
NEKATGEYKNKKANAIVDMDLEENKLFILDHHDALMPYLTKINSTASKIYATRTVLLLLDDSTLKPLAIELRLPNTEPYHKGCTSEVFTPSEDGVQGTIWQLAKAYAVVNDSGYHHLISHWLNTHAVIEPFIIVTNRQLSVLHPIFKFLQPHFHDTMNINALARQTSLMADLKERLLPPKPASAANLRDTYYRPSASGRQPLQGVDVPSLKKRGQGLRLWIRVDAATGDSQVIEVDRFIIMRLCDLPARDLRLLDPLFVYPSTILRRENAIVVSSDEMEIHDEIKVYLGETEDSDVKHIAPFPLLEKKAVEFLRYRAEVESSFLRKSTRFSREQLVIKKSAGAGAVTDIEDLHL